MTPANPPTPPVVVHDVAPVARWESEPAIDWSLGARLVRKHGRLVAALAGAAALVGALVALGRSSIYTAATTLLLEPRHPQVLTMQTVRADEVHDELRYIRTQYEVLRSRALAERVIRDWGLRHEPLLGGTPATADTDWSQLDGGLVDAYLAGLAVEPVAGTRLIQVAYTATDPELAARVANAHAEAYIEFGNRDRATTNEAGLEFLRARLVELRERLERSEALLNAYRWDKGIIALTDRENVVVEQLDSQIKQLAEAEGARLALEADVHALEKHGPDALPEVVEHGGLHELTVHLALAESEYARAAARFKPGYPKVDALKRQVDSLRARIAGETDRVVRSIHTAYEAAREEEAQMRARLEEQKARALKLKDESIQYAILQREVETNRQLYDSVLQRMKEIAVAAELRQSNVSVVDQAVTPTAASGPARLRIVVVAAIFGALLGFGIVLVRETLDDRVKTLVQAERQSRLPSLGAVPAMTTTPLAPRTSLLDHLDAPSRATPVQAIVLPKHSPSAVTDAYRTIRTSLLLARPGAPARTVLVASALDGDGKTTTAINLAAAFAQLDASVLVVDADLRRPSCHGLLGVPGAPGLSEVLCGRADLKQVLRPVPGHPLHLLPAGDTPPNPTELLGSDEMRELLATLAGQFDYVFVDSPAARGMADALVLSTLADGVVVVARHEHTPRRLLAAVCDRFAYARAPMLGLVLNGVDDAADPYTPYITLHVTPGPPAPRRGTGERAA